MRFLETYYAIVSGVHSTIPLSELEAVLWAERYEYQVLSRLDQVVLFKASRSPRTLVERAAYTQEIGKHITVCSQDPTELVECFRDVDWREALKGYNGFYVSFRRIRGVAKKLRLRELASLLGGIIARETGLKASTKGAAIRVVLVEGVALVGLLLGVQIEKFDERKPQYKPFFKPGALDPRLSRAFVNLARIPRGGLYYDPFCGTGGFAVEAERIGLNTLCSDIDRVMVEGAAVNTRHYMEPVYSECFQADAARLPLRSEIVDGIATDPPYGRSTTTRGRSVKKVLEDFLAQSIEVLKKKRFLVFASPHWVDADYLAENTGFKIVEEHYMRVHGSLTRLLLVVYKA